MNEYYERKLEQGLLYQDFIVEKLYNIGLPIISYSSKKYQHEIGENKCGFEIKFDDRMKQTGNIYIEFAEKSDANNMSFVASGIYRNDNTWLYIIGDYTTVYLFGKKQLQLLHQQNEVVLKETPTSKGFLLNRAYAEKELAIKVLKL